MAVLKKKKKKRFTIIIIIFYGTLSLSGGDNGV